MEQNYYEILELPLNPLIRNPEEALSLIDERVRMWNRHITGPKGTLYKYYRELAPEMRRVLGEHKQLHQQGRDAFKRTQEQILHFIRWAAGSHRCLSDAQFAAIVQRYPLMGECNIRELARRACVRIGRIPELNISPSPQPPPQPDPSEFPLPSMQKLKELQLNLRVLGKKSPYELLACSNETPLPELQAQLAFFKDRVRRLPAGKSNKDASNRASMLMSDFFARNETRCGFDEAWQLHTASQQVLADIELLLTDIPPRITRDQYDGLIADLVHQGIARSKASWFIYNECCIRRKAPLPPLASSSAPSGNVITSRQRHSTASEPVGLPTLPNSRNAPRQERPTPSIETEHVRRDSNVGKILLSIWFILLAALIICCVIKYKRMQRMENLWYRNSMIEQSAYPQPILPLDIAKRLS